MKHGVYNHSFQCQLPAKLPTSVSGKHGYIKYGVRVVIDIAFWPNKEYDQPFTVIKEVNLNHDPGLRVC